MAGAIDVGTKASAVLKSTRASAVTIEEESFIVQKGSLGYTNVGTVCSSVNVNEGAFGVVSSSNFLCVSSVCVIVLRCFRSDVRRTIGEREKRVLHSFLNGWHISHQHVQAAPSIKLTVIVAKRNERIRKPKALDTLRIFHLVVIISSPPNPKLAHVFAGLSLW